MRSKRGFTLIEILVVIGIITVLISLLLPVLSKARDAANRIVCASNLKQLATAELMYLNDNHDTFFTLGPSDQGFIGQFSQKAYYPNASTPTYVNNDDFFNFYSQYLGGTLDITTWNSGTGIVNQSNGPNGLRWNPSKVLTCPSNRERTDWSTAGYFQCVGSTADFKLNRSTLTGACHGATANCGYSIENPAVFADIVVWASFAQTGLTNHWDRSTNQPAGGNVANLDGSVSWLPFKNAAHLTGVDVYGPISWWNGAAVPGNTVACSTDAYNRTDRSLVTFGAYCGNNVAHFSSVFR